MTEPRYPFVVMDVPPERADELSALLFELGASGVEERDDQTLARGSGKGVVTLVGSFEDREQAEQAVASLEEFDESLHARIEEVVGDAWRDAWKQYFEPFALNRRVTVVPPWVAYQPTRPDELVLELEPGRAFGTGLHATTSLVAEMLAALEPRLAGKEVLDVGTGSGILAFTALLLGASRAHAIDNDEEVIEVVRENAERNRLSDRIEVEHATLDRVDRSFPFVLANIETRILRPLARDLLRVLSPGGCLILSGILSSEHDAIVELYTSFPRRLERVETMSRRGEGDGDDWVAIRFEEVR